MLQSIGSFFSKTDFWRQVKKSKHRDFGGKKILREALFYFKRPGRSKWLTKPEKMMLDISMCSLWKLTLLITRQDAAYY